MEEFGEVVEEARLRNHWWPRPGWTEGRLIFTWHLTFCNALTLYTLVARCHDALRPLPGLDLVPPRWLHLTMQGVAWADEIDRNDLKAVYSSVRNRVDGLSSLDLELGPAVVKGEAIVLPPHPVEPLYELLRRIRLGIEESVGASANSPAGRKGEFRPHVSLAYSHIDARAEPYRAALQAVGPATASVHVDAVTLICQERLLTPDRLYRWTETANAQLGP